MAGRTIGCLAYWTIFFIFGVVEAARRLGGIPGYSRITPEELIKLSDKPRAPSVVLFHAYKGKPKGKSIEFLRSLPQFMQEKYAKVKLYIFDCFDKPNVCGNQGVQVYPSLLIHANQNKIMLKPPYSQKVLKQKLNELLFIDSEEILTELEMVYLKETLKHKGSTVRPVVFFCGSPALPTFKKFDELSKLRKGEQYYYSQADSVMKYLNCTEGDILFITGLKTRKNKQHSDKPFSLERFIMLNKYRNVRILNYYSFREFFSDSKPMLILLTKSKKEPFISLLNKVGKLEGNSTYIYYLYETKMNNELVKKVDNRLGVVTDDKPTLRYVKVLKNSIVQYRLKGEISKDTVMAFIKNIKEGKETPYLRSQPMKEHHKHFKVVDDDTEAGGNKLSRILQ